MILVTVLLGSLFVVLQIVGFSQLVASGNPLSKTNSVDFLYVIVGLHGLHVIAGIVILIVMLLKAFSKKIKTYTPVPIELTSTYWHFVGILWVYLLIFLVLIK
jgi:cytochrome c oxidase subunit 3